MSTESKASRQKRYKEKKMMGLCRVCKNHICKSSKIFCEKHLIQNSKRKDPIKHRLSRMKCRAGRSKIEFALSQSDFSQWFDNQPKNCCYCGVTEDVLNFNADAKKRKLTIDRKDNNIGYHIDNICLACFRCNNQKSDFFTHEEWSDIANRTIKPRLRQYHRLAYEVLEYAKLQKLVTE